MLKKNIYILFSPFFSSQPRIIFSLFHLFSFLHLCSFLSTDPTQTQPLLSLSSLFLLCWVRCLGCGWVVGPVFGSWLGCVWVVGDSVGQWWLWLWVTPSLHHSRNGHISFYESNHRDDHLVRFPIVKPLTLCRVSNAHMWGDVVFRPKIPHPLLGVY